MLDVQVPSSVVSTVPSNPRNPYLSQTPYNYVLPAKLADLVKEENERREQLRAASRSSERDYIPQWLEGTRAAQSQATISPAGQSATTTTNAMLAPTYGGLYNSTTSARPVGTRYRSHSYDGFNTVSNPQNLSPSRLQSPTQPKEIAGPPNSSSKKSPSAGNQIVSYLQIPASINDSKGSLAEFAAQIACLFWFESSFTLHRVEEAAVVPTPSNPLVPEALPTMGFQKWVTTILSTTQVTQNVILLALMFIYRLKKLNPTVKGKAGSEYRLLTVALMLGNKFLDDNTYTNKTWAEVSGISVQEIHIMEVEFLSNMRYTLYASDVEWSRWHRFKNQTLGATKYPHKLASYTSVTTGLNPHVSADHECQFSEQQVVPIPKLCASLPCSFHTITSRTDARGRPEALRKEEKLRRSKSRTTFKKTGSFVHAPFYAFYNKYAKSHPPRSKITSSESLHFYEQPSFQLQRGVFGTITPTIRAGNVNDLPRCLSMDFIRESSHSELTSISTPQLLTTHV